MRKLRGFAFGVAAAAVIGGAAIAAVPRTHRMDVPLPDGAVAHVEYVGDVAPKITVAPAPLPDAGSPWAMAFPSFGGFDRMIQEMNRRTQEIARQAQAMASQAPSAAAGVAPVVAAYGSLPQGVSSTTVMSVSNGGGTCTRTTQVVSQGAGKPPRVTSSVSGDCASEAPAPAGPANRT